MSRFYQKKGNYKRIQKRVVNVRKKQQRENYELLRQRQTNRVRQCRMRHRNSQNIYDAKNFFEFAQFERFQLPTTIFCEACGAKKFARESPGLCCANGKVVLVEHDVPEKLR